VQVVRRSVELDGSPSDTSGISENPVQQESLTKTESAVSSLEIASIETSAVKSQCCQTDECPVEASMLVVDAQNSPIHFQTTISVGCTPVQLPTTVAEVSVETVECLVQTSPNVVDASCSPVHTVLTCSIGCSPVDIETRSAVTSPILFLPTVMCSMQTEPWMTDASCSPMIAPYSEGSHTADAKTSPQQYSAKHSTASFTTDTPVSPNLQQDKPLSACRKVASVMESQSSYTTAEDPLHAAATDSQQSFRDSTLPHSCEELFDNSPLSCRSPPSAAQQLPSTSSQNSDLETSPAATVNTISETESADSAVHATNKLHLFSQVLPQFADKDE